MNTRVILALMVLAGVSAESFGQVPPPTVSEPCRAVHGQSLAQFEQRKSALEAELAETKLKLQAFNVGVAPQPSSPNATQENALKELLAKQQGEAIELLYMLDCFRTDLTPVPDARGDGSLVEITSFYATNRQATGNSDPYRFYDARDTRKLAYGQTVVSIPSTHRIGQLELPSLWKLQLNPDPSKHFVVRSVTPLREDDAKAQLAASLQSVRSKSLLLFVHGFNVTFAEAALRTAQLAQDLRFPGISMFYSWPSAGAFVGYLHDEEVSDLARSIFDQLLEDISKLGFEAVYLVAHSMGNRIVTRTLATRLQEGKEVSKVRELMLAAPDINAEIFRTEIAPKLLAMTSARKTIYASSKDLALLASKVVHGFRRVGETSNGVLTYDQITTVDASGVASIIRAFGHSYVMDSTPVLNDIEDIVVWRRTLAERPALKQQGAPPNIYWRFE